MICVRCGSPYRFVDYVDRLVDLCDDCMEVEISDREWEHYLHLRNLDIFNRLLDEG